MPPESRRWRELLRSWDLLAEQYGYAYVATPIFEATDLFARGVGEATEVVEKQMYSFRDKGGRHLTLRPEVTAGVLRAYIQAGLSGEFKGAYSGPCFRYERPRRAVAGSSGSWGSSTWAPLTPRPTWRLSSSAIATCWIAASGRGRPRELHR